MSNLIDIQTQILKLQKQADEIRSKEFDKTVQDILAKMQAFGITVKDLNEAAGKLRKGRGRPVGVVKRAAGSKKKNPGVAVAAKFRGPNGEAWSGRGLMPKWLSALVAQGRSKEEFAISP